MKTLIFVLDTEDPGYSVATNTGTLENDEVLRELAGVLSFNR